MATLEIVITGVNQSPSVVNRITKPKRVILQGVDGRKRRFEFPFGPKEVRYEGEGIDYISIERPGLVALLEADATKARTISFSAVIADERSGGKVSQENQLEILRVMAKEDIDLTFTYGVRTLNYRVRITSLSIDSVQRDLNGNITQAGVSIQLTERPRRTIDPVTLNAIRYTPPSKPPSKSGSTKTGSTSTKPSGQPSKPALVIKPIVTPPYNGSGTGPFQPF